MLTHWLLDFGRNVEESLDRPASNFDVAGNFYILIGHFTLTHFIILLLISGIPTGRWSSGTYE